MSLRIRRDLLGLAPRATLPVPAVDAATMLAVDRLTTDGIGLSLLQMMENAGRELATLGRSAMGGEAEGRRVVVLAGSGNNAGGGLVAARRLAGWGASVTVLFAQPVLRLRPGPCAQLESVIASGSRLAVVGHDFSVEEARREVRAADLVLDALIGYSLSGSPSEPYQRLIALAAQTEAAVISLDLPSGLDASTGATPGVAIRADITLAVALPKLGTQLGHGPRLTGVQYLADIGIPASAFREVGVEVGPIFSASCLIELAS